MSLADIITKVRSGEGNPHEDWLLIAGNAGDLKLDTDCALSIIEIDEDSPGLEEIVPRELKERGLTSTIDYQTLRDCIGWADRLAGRSDDAAAAEVIRYYIRFDAWPDRLGATDSPPADEIIDRLDREFFESLGPEREGTKCKRDGCSRGTVAFSAFCAVHHFESVKKKPCPYPGQRQA